MTSPRKPKRLGRNSDAHRMRAELFGEQGKSFRLTSHLWPDAYELLAIEAAANGLTMSGMNHQIIRNHYHLPPVP